MAGYPIYLSLGITICKLGIIFLLQGLFMEVKQNGVCKSPNKVPKSHKTWSRKKNRLSDSIKVKAFFVMCIREQLKARSHSESKQDCSFKG